MPATVPNGVAKTALEALTNKRNALVLCYGDDAAPPAASVERARANSQDWAARCGRVITNEGLRALVRYVPKDKEALGELKHWGPSKIQEYGDKFLRVLEPYRMGLELVKW